MIGLQCFNDGDTNPGDDSLFCDAADPENWTKKGQDLKEGRSNLHTNSTVWHMLPPHYMVIEASNINLNCKFVSPAKI